MFRTPLLQRCRHIAPALLLLALTLVTLPASAGEPAGEDPAQIRLQNAEGLLAGALGISPDQLRSSLRGRDSTSQNLDLFFYSAGAEKLDQGTAWVVVDRDGKQVDLDAIEAEEGREFFSSARAMLEKPPAVGCSTIYGFKWHDQNANGVHDSGEPFLANWDIVITNLTLQQSYLVTTGSNGYYFLTGLPAGTYEVSEIADMDWIQTFPPSGTHLLTLGACDVAQANFGNSYLGPCHLGCSVEVSCGGPWNGSDGACHANASGVPPFQYQWQYQGPIIDPVPGGPSFYFWCPTSNQSPPPYIQVGVTVTDACGCVAQDWALFTCPANSGGS